MKRIQPMCRALVALLGAVIRAIGCGESPAQPAASEAPRASAGAGAPRTERAIPARQDPPAADGECAVTRGDDRSTYTYASGRLQRSTWSRDDRVTTYTYEGERLVRVERRNPREVYFTVVSPVLRY